MTCDSLLTDSVAGGTKVPIYSFMVDATCRAHAYTKMFLKQTLCFTTCWLTLPNGVWNKIANIAQRRYSVTGGRVNYWMM